MRKLVNALDQETSEKFTPGPWRWELNQKSRQVELCGGGFRPGTYDWRVLTFRRWGMTGAQPEFWTWRDDVGEPQLASALAVPARGREHHKEWFAMISHPDAYLIAAAPDMYAALKGCLRFIEDNVRFVQPNPESGEEPADRFSYEAQPICSFAQAALKKARGE